MDGKIRRIERSTPRLLSVIAEVFGSPVYFAMAFVLALACAISSADAARPIKKPSGAKDAPAAEASVQPPAAPAVPAPSPAVPSAPSAPAEAKPQPTPEASAPPKPKPEVQEDPLLPPKEIYLGRRGHLRIPEGMEYLGRDAQVKAYGGAFGEGSLRLQGVSEKEFSAAWLWPTAGFASPESFLAKNQPEVTEKDLIRRFPGLAWIVKPEFDAQAKSLCWFFVVDSASSAEGLRGGCLFFGAMGSLSIEMKSILSRKEEALAAQGRMKAAFRFD